LLNASATKPKNTNCTLTRQNVRFLGKPAHLTNFWSKPCPVAKSHPLTNTYKNLIKDNNFSLRIFTEFTLQSVWWVKSKKWISDKKRSAHQNQSLEKSRVTKIRWRRRNL
jgi:hypothetical protein